METNGVRRITKVEMEKALMEEHNIKPGAMLLVLGEVLNKWSDGHDVTYNPNAETEMPLEYRKAVFYDTVFEGFDAEGKVNIRNAELPPLYFDRADYVLKYEDFMSSIRDGSVQPA